MGVNATVGEMEATRNVRWMSADNRHYTPPAGVLVWTQSAVRVTHTHAFSVNAHEAPKNLILSYILCVSV